MIRKPVYMYMYNIYILYILRKSKNVKYVLSFRHNGRFVCSMYVATP
jgi:hypothetical protein